MASKSKNGTRTNFNEVIMKLLSEGCVYQNLIYVKCEANKVKWWVTKWKCWKVSGNYVV